MNRRQFRRLLYWNHLIVPLLTVGLIVGGLWLLSPLVLGEDEGKKPSIRWDRETLQCIPADDRPIVITHLVHYDHTSESKKIVAVLPEPLAIVDHSIGRIDPEAIRRLDWHFAIGGKPAPAPSPDIPIEAVYYYPSLSGQSTIAKP